MDPCMYGCLPLCGAVLWRFSRRAKRQKNASVQTLAVGARRRAVFQSAIRNRQSANTESARIRLVSNSPCFPARML